ncbi:MAG: ABC transporter permease subunit [Verrucomicrobiota bacterium]
MLDESPSIASQARLNPTVIPQVVRGVQTLLSPVFVRELRTESRRISNYWMRLAGPAAALLVFWIVMSDYTGSMSRAGWKLFQILNTTVFLAIVFIGPLLTADCLSREKREGTLGLLFLTPLSPHEVILGKMLIHSARGLSMLVASIPMLSLPLVLGGVPLDWAMKTTALLLGMMLLALTAGLIASSQEVEWLRAVIRAEMLSVGFAAVFLLLSLGIWWTLNLSFDGLVLATAVFLFAIHRCGRRLKIDWEKQSTALPQPEWTKAFSRSAFWRGFFRWDTRRTLDHNPIAWLQEYSWTARLTKWGWCFLILGAQVFVPLALLVIEMRFRFSEMQTGLGLALGIGMAFSAANSFRAERQTGALELMLVTPLTPRQLIGGRLWGLWGQFLPAAAVLICVTGLFPIVDVDRRINLAVLFTIAYVTLPIIGLFFSIQRWHFLVAWLATCVSGLLLPYWGSLLMDPFARFDLVGVRFRAPILAACLVQMLLAWASFSLLKRNLTSRRFALESFRH